MRSAAWLGPCRRENCLHCLALFVRRRSIFLVVLGRFIYRFLYPLCSASCCRAKAGFVFLPVYFVLRRSSAAAARRLASRGLLAMTRPVLVRVAPKLVFHHQTKLVPDYIVLASRVLASVILVAPFLYHCRAHPGEKRARALCETLPLASQGFFLGSFPAAKGWPPSPCPSPDSSSLQL